jgi:hypothetical protein
MERDGFHGGRGKVESGLEHSGAILGSKMVEISEVVPIFDQSAVLPAASEVEADSLEAQELDVLRGAAQFTSKNGPDLAQFADEGGLYR